MTDQFYVDGAKRIFHKGESIWPSIEGFQGYDAIKSLVKFRFSKHFDFGEILQLLPWAHKDIRGDVMTIQLENTAGMLKLTRPNKMTLFDVTNSYEYKQWISVLKKLKELGGRYREYAALHASPFLEFNGLVSDVLYLFNLGQRVDLVKVFENHRNVQLKLVGKIELICKDETGRPIVRLSYNGNGMFHVKYPFDTTDILKWVEVFKQYPLDPDTKTDVQTTTERIATITGIQ